MPTTTLARPSVDELRRRHPVGERRSLTVPAEVRAEGSDRKLTGHAAVFNTPTAIGGFVEEIAPGAFARALSRPGADPALLWDHDSAAPLARRSAGTLELVEDARGLRFSATVARTQAGNDVLELVAAGIVKGASFGFTVKRDHWSERDGTPHRRILEVGQLFECSIVTFPAYDATDVRGRRPYREEVDARKRTAAATRGRLAARPVTYRHESGHSYFRDLATVAHAQRQLAAASEHRQAGTRDFLGGSPLFGERSEGGMQGGLEEARKRLATVERRDVGVADWFETPHAPAYLADVFATAARARAVMPGLLDVGPLPPDGDPVTVARVTTGIAAAPRASGGSVAETDAILELENGPVVELAAQVDVDRQALERSAPSLDAAIARELGEALATALDAAIINGAGAPSLTGLLGTSGIASVTYDDASPTQAEAWAKLTELVATVGTALGYPPTAIVAHGRRIAWLANWKDTAGAQVRIDWPAPLRAANTVPSNLGAGTNQDRILVLAGAEIPLRLGPVEWRAYPQVGSSTGAVRLQAFQHVALVADRRPEAIGALVGTGLAAPAFA